MKEKNTVFRLNFLLALVLGVYCAVVAGMRVYNPMAIRPKLSLPVMAGLCLAALVLEAYLGRPKKRAWIPTLALGAACFFLFPAAAGILEKKSLVEVGVAGTIVFAVTTLLYGGMCERIGATGRKGLAPLCTGFVFFLAAQALFGMF